MCFLWPHLLNWDLLSGWLPAFTAHVGTRLTHLYFCPLCDAIPPTPASCPGGVVCSTNLPENKLKFVVPKDKGRCLCFYMDRCAPPMGMGNQYLADPVSLLPDRSQPPSSTEQLSGSGSFRDCGRRAPRRELPQRMMWGQRVVMKTALKQIYDRTVSSRDKEGTHLVLGGLGGALEEATATWKLWRTCMCTDLF